MSYEKSIHRIGIVGTGVIGELGRPVSACGFDVVATDPAPNAEAGLRKYVDDAWGCSNPSAFRRERRATD